LRIVILDSELLLAESLSVVLRRRGHQAQSQRVHPCHTESSLLESVRRAAPVIVVLDLDLGDRIDGARLIAPLDRLGIDVVVLTDAVDPLVRGACLDQGAATVLDKAGALDAVVTAVHRLAIGQPAMDPARRRELIACWRAHGPAHESERQRLTRLTPREHEVLSDLAAGRQVPEIAAAKEMSPATVRTHVKSILGKLGVSSQLAAAVLRQRYDRQQGGRGQHR
jgi:two-component system nitrate/nitrite response regulator NarL